MFYGRETSAQWFSLEIKGSRGNPFERQKVSRSLLETPRDSWRLSRFCICFYEHNDFTQKVVADIFPVSIILLENFQVVSELFHKCYMGGKHVRDHFRRKFVSFIEVNVK